MALTLTKILREAIKKRLPPAIIQHYQKLDYADRVTDQILQREYARSVIKTDPQTEFLVTNNRVQKTLSYQMEWDGVQWRPKLTREEIFTLYTKAEGPLTLAAKTGYTIIDLKGRRGKIEYIEIAADIGTVYTYMYIDDLCIKYVADYGSLKDYIYAGDMADNGTGAFYWELTNYNESEALIKINLKSNVNIVFLNSFKLYIYNHYGLERRIGYSLGYRLGEV